MKYKYIKLATQEDLEKHEKYMLKNLYNDKYKHLFGSSFYLQDLSKKKNDGWNYIIFNILDDEKNVIGMIQFNINRGNYVHSLNGIYVQEEYIGLGFGKKALIEFIDFCRTRFIRIELTTSSQKLSNFYEEIGFRLVGIFKQKLRLSDYKIYDEYAMEILF